MKKSFLILIAFVVNQVFIQAEPLRLMDAIKQKKVSVKSVGNGGYQGDCISLSVKNLTATKQEIQVTPGLIFTAVDSTAQNLMAIQEYAVSLMPGATNTIAISTVCIQAHDHAPYAKSGFVLNREAKGNLYALAEFIADKDYQNSTAQSAVWSITDNYSLNDIYGTDTLMANSLSRMVTKLTGRQRDKPFVPKPHNIYAININMTHHFATSKKITLACFDSTGALIKEYYKDKQIPQGIYVANFHINRVADKGTKFIFRMTDEKGVVVKERIITESISEPKAEKFRLDVSFQYILKTPVTGATMSLYDDKDNLIEEMYTNRDFPAGGRRQEYSFFHTKGKNSIFYVKLKDGTGKLIMVYKIEGSKSVKVVF